MTSSLGQLGPGDTEWGDFPSTAYQEKIASATSLPQLRSVGFDGGDAAMQADVRAGRYPCPTYKATKAMLNKVGWLLRKMEPFLHVAGDTVMAGSVPVQAWWQQPLPALCAGCRCGSPKRTPDGGAGASCRQHSSWQQIRCSHLAASASVQCARAPVPAT